MALENEKEQLQLDRQADTRSVLSICGNWNIVHGIPATDSVMKELAQPLRSQQLFLNADRLTGWDSSLLSFLTKLQSRCAAEEIELVTDGLPDGIRRLLALASAVPKEEETQAREETVALLPRVGKAAVAQMNAALEMLGFLGDAVVAFLKLCQGKARFRKSDVFLLLQECGAQALPIVSLISILVGMILAFVSAIQLKMFGAQIFVADLVGIGMTREMGAMMAAIIMAGRTGAAFAAQLGTMTVNEEIDAISTMGFSPIEFLVLPRMLALVLMMPLLCVYADLMGVVGGAIVGVNMPDVTWLQYYEKTRHAVSMTDCGIGLFKSAVFGMLVAISGCLRGMQCGRSASAVGQAATSAVVTGIVLIIVADAIITILCDVIGI